MARHMMQNDMLHNDMADNHAAVSYYAGTRSIFWGFYWYAYFTYRYQSPAGKSCYGFVHFHPENVC